jgi:hypothetical protein
MRIYEKLGKAEQKWYTCLGFYEERTGEYFLKRKGK